MSDSRAAAIARKHANFRLAVGALLRFLAEPVRSEAVEAGIIQGFEFTFEQAWKAFQAIATSEGLAVVSPKTALQAALKLGLVEDEELWLGMLEDRNLSSHTYRQELAHALVMRIETRYSGALLAAAQRIDAAWLTPEPR